MFARLLLIVGVVVMSGCAIVPDSIDVPENTVLVSYTKAVTASHQALGQKARWGGIVVGVENKPNATFIEMVHFPLNHYGKPRRNDETVGRFKVKIEGFVDPIAFEEGRSATFLGVLTSPTSGMVGEQPYIYPTIIAEDYHMWREQTTYDVNPFFFNYHTGWYSPYFFANPRFGLYHPYVGFGNPFFGPFGGRFRVTQYGDRPVKVDIRSRSSSKARPAKPQSLEKMNGLKQK